MKPFYRLVRLAEGMARTKPSDKGVAGDAVVAQDPAILKRVAGSSHAEKIFRWWAASHPAMVLWNPGQFLQEPALP